MMEQKRLVPKRRFEGFNEAWEEKALKNITDVRDGTHDSPKFYSKGHPLVTSKNVKNGEINYLDVQYISDQDFEEINKRSKVDKNDILMGMIGTIGNIALINKLPDFAIKNVALIKDTGNIYYLYLYYYLESPYIKKKLLDDIDGGTQKFISLGKIRDLLIILPELKEQQKIGQFFKHLDEMIAIQQRKLDKSKALKSAYLAEMFPAEGERVPKRRFEGFTGEWEEYKLSDLAEISTGKAFSSIDFDDKGKYLVVTNKNIQDQSKSIESVGSRINISEKLVLDNYVLRGNNILITMDGNVGRVRKYSDDNAVLAQRVARLNSKQFEFVYQITRKSQFISKMNEVSVGNIIKHISLKQISDYLFMAPQDKKEQEKIGNLLKNIDDIIITHQQKLEKLKATKQAYLHEMFV